MVKFDRADFTRIYTALVLPCNADESINWDSVRRLVDRQIEDGVEGFYCCGSSGGSTSSSVFLRCRNFPHTR